MNLVVLMGRLTRDPEIRYSQGANPTAIAHYTLAVDRRFKREGQPDADFFSCTVFGRGAEFAEKYLKKGTKVVVQGELQNNNYTNQQGEKVYSTNIVVNSQEFAESKAASQQAQANAQSAPAQNAPAQAAPQAAPAPNAADDFMNIPDEGMEDLPFN